MSARTAAALAALLASGCAAPAPAPAPTPTPTPAPVEAAYAAPPASDWVAACTDWDDWDKPGPPFRIHGNSFYVGTCGIAAVLVTAPQGHVLIDTGTEAGAETVLANVERLGFDPRDIAVLLSSHEHFDHVGGAALVQQRTGADLYASAPAAAVLASGEAGEDDPQAGMHDPMAPASVGRIVRPGETVEVGPLRLTMIATPGHTPGAVSWQWQSCEGEDCRSIVYADSLSPVSANEYRFSDHAAYLAAYRAGLAELAALDCDILLTPHPSASQMRERLVAGDLTDATACRTYAASIDARLNERLAADAAR